MSIQLPAGSAGNVFSGNIAAKDGSGGFELTADKPNVIVGCRYFSAPQMPIHRPYAPLDCRGVPIKPAPWWRHPINGVYADYVGRMETRMGCLGIILAGAMLVVPVVALVSVLLLWIAR